MADSTIDGLPTLASVDRTTDKLAIWDASDSQTKEATINATLGFSAGNPVSSSDAQSLTNKTFDNSNVFTIRDDRLTLQDNGDTTKQAAFQLSGITTGTTRTFTLPDATTTLVGTDTTQTLTNKTLTSPTINTATISNPTLTVDTISEFTLNNGVTIDGLLIKDGALPAGNIKPNQLQSGTGTTWAYQSYTPNWVNLTVNNGTVIAYYLQIGKRVHYFGRLTFGSNTSVTGQADVSLPVNASANVPDYAPIGTINAWDQSANAYYMGWGWKANGAPNMRFIFGASGGTYTTATGTSSTVPFTWTTSDLLFWDISYEAA